MRRFILREEFFGGLLFDSKTLILRSLGKCDAKGYANRQDTLYLRSDRDPNSNTLSAPTKVFLVITRNCNLQCSHCLNESGPGRKEMLGLEEITDSIHILSRMGVFEIGINGGEPLMHPEFNDIIRLIKSRNLSTFLNTNGVLSSRQLSELIHLGIDTVKVSVDGLESTHDRNRGAGTFQKAIQTVRALKSADSNVHLNLTLSTHNVVDVFGLIELAESLQCKLKIASIVNVGRAKSENLRVQLEVGQRLSEKINKFLQDRHISISVEMTEDLVESDCLRIASACNYQYTNCGNQRVHLSIDTNGDVYNTGRQTHFEKVGAIGNISKSSIDELWRVSQLKNEATNAKYDKCLLCDSRSLLLDSFNHVPTLNWWK